MGLSKKLFSSYVFGSTLNAGKRSYNRMMEKNIRHGEFGKHWKFYTGLVLLGIGLHMCCGKSSHGYEPTALPTTTYQTTYCGTLKETGTEYRADRHPGELERIIETHR